MNKKVVKRGILPYAVLIIFLFGIMFFADAMNTEVHEITYDKFISEVEEKEVKEVTITPNSSGSIYIISGKLKEYKTNESFTFNMPLTDETMVKILEAADKSEFTMKTAADGNSNPIFLFIINYLPTIILIGITFYAINRVFGKQMDGNRSMDFGRSKAKLSSGDNKVTFKEVAGLDEEKEELSELIDFLKSPKKFQKMGARIPKGVLLVGPPGTGKTLLAKAVAGEANVPFYFISGSDFVELFVGVGASRVRDMFKQAKQSAPCLIFIDEIDAVGRQRGAGLGGGHDEREQTLNQLLTEMDGFGANEGIIIIAATNRPDVLDPALLRPGRFDRQVTVNLPDAKGREEILAVHAKGKTFAPNITLSNLAKRTVGFSGADLENLLNEAALLTVRRNKKAITMSEIDEAHDRVLMGPAKKSHKYTDDEKKTVAYHEAGHAVVGLKLDGANDVQKITIIPRGQAGGYNLMLPKEETYLRTKKQLLDSISGFLGGRVAEEIMFKEVTTGAQNDFEKATKIARAMVTEYGMSDLGVVQYEEQQSSVFLGRDYNNRAQHFSHEVAKQIDEEISKIMKNQYKVTKKIIEENMDLLKLIAETLLEYETITKEQIDYLVENGKMPEEDIKEQDEDKENKPKIKEAKLEDLTLEDLQDIAKEKGIKDIDNLSKKELIDKMKNKDKE
ncbi:MAG: ATP-dependent zinc metalloprotease FtsH [Bacilli bacterium]|nr:ATP-dependent zinc metalloprotease FtsH [Bacilli bacterium]